MKRERMSELLHDLAQEAIPPDVNLWQGVRAGVENHHRKSSPQRLPVARLGWAVAILVVLLSFATATYAIDPTVNKLLREMLGMSGKKTSQYIKNLDLTQTIEGITVSVQAVYADANQIVIGMAIKNPNRERYTASDFRLTTDDGTPLEMAMGMGVVGESDVLDVRLQPGEEAHVITFDASKIQGSPKRLKLHLTIKMQEFTIITVDGTNIAGEQGGLDQVTDSSRGNPGQPPFVVRSDGTTTTQDIIAVAGAPTEPGKQVGPFAFEFEVPLLPGRTVELHEKTTAAGIEMELQKVTITPSQIRATVCFTPPEPGAWSVITDTDRTMPTAGNTRMVRIGGSEEPCQTLLLPINLNEAGGGKLKVTELIKFSVPFDGKQERLQGPWVFDLPQP